jgi:hypothetical protein
MALRQLSAAEFLELGLDIAGYTERRTERTCYGTSIRRFHGHYGVSPETCAALFVDFQTTAIPAGRINKPDPFYMMLGLDWLKTYKTEEQMTAAFDLVENTAGDWAWKYAKAIQGLKDDKKVSKTIAHVYFFQQFVLTLSSLSS